MALPLPISKKPLAFTRIPPSTMPNKNASSTSNAYLASSAELPAVNDVNLTTSNPCAPLSYSAFISSLSVAEDPKLIVGLPSFTALYMVKSPATKAKVPVPSPA